MASKSERTSALKTAAATPGVVRPRYRERQVLRVADLEAQQSYLIEARRRHNIGQHGWGIVRGLEILDTPELVVQPGVAVDGYGRELIVAAPLKIPAEVFNKLEDNALDVWLVYELADANVPQRGSWSCGPGKNTRASEYANLRLTSAAQTPERLPKGGEDPREPIEVPSADLPFLPHRTPPDDPAMEWPVYLGTIKMQTVPDYDPRSPRPFATLTGETVVAPSGVARMQVGSELQSDGRIFAVTLANAAGKLIERVGIDREGNTFITGNTTVKKSLTDVNSNELHVRVGPARLLNFRPLAATPAAAAPWQIYRTSVKENKRPIQQLRFEIAHPGDKAAPELSRLVIGKRAAGVFSACFTVSADCTLTIEGDVNVGGQLVEGPVQPDATDPRFAGLLAQNWLVGTKVGEVGATTGTIQGTVTDTNRVPMPNVSVELKSNAFTRNIVTDLVGRFVAPVIPIGGYTITAEPPGFKRTVVQTTLDRGGTVDVLLTLERIQFGTITGTVIDTLGAVIPGANVELTHTTTLVTRTVTTDNQGRFIVPQIPSGSYSIRVVVPGFTPVTHVLPANQTIDITLTVTAAIPP
jgi:hypothetical protein